MTKIILSKTEATVRKSGKLTSGMVGEQIEIEYSAEWQGLSVTAVFTNGTSTVDVLNPGTLCTVPHEVLAAADKELMVGFYGSRLQNGEIVLAIPTVYADLGTIEKGAAASGTVGSAASSAIWQQLQAAVGVLSELETVDKSNLVEAINEARQSSGGSPVWGNIGGTLSNQADLQSALSGKISTGMTVEVILLASGAAATAAYDSAANKLTLGIPKGDKGDTGETGATGAAGTTDHTQLGNLGSANQHPISAITGLQVALDAKGTYSKPAAGIPKADLASEVQTSLGKADTALQSHQSLAAQQTKSIADEGAYFTTDTVEGALQELGEDKSERADKVTEVGSSGMWYYRKWESGLTECWGQLTAATQNASSWGNGWYIHQLSAISFPASLFAGAPLVELTPCGTTMSMMVCRADVTASAVTVFITDQDSRTALNKTLAVRAFYNG